MDGHPFFYLIQGVREGYPMCCIIAFWADADGNHYDPLTYTGLPSGRLRGAGQWVPCWDCIDRSPISPVV